MEEYRSRLGASERIWRKMAPIVYKGSPYADRLPIGLPEIIEKAPASRLKDFYDKWYRAQNMAVILVGDFDAAAMEKTMADHFKIHDDGGKFEHPEYDLPDPVKGSFEAFVFTDPELTRTRADIYFKRSPEVRSATIEGYRKDIVGYLVSSMLSMRFNDAAAKPETPYMWAGSGEARYGHSSRYYLLVAQAKTGTAKETLSSLFTEKESLLRYGFLRGELDIAGRSLVSYMEQQYGERDRQESQSYVDLFTQHFLDGGSLADIEWELDAVRKMLPTITLDEVNETVKSYFEDDDVMVFITASEAEKNSLPDTDGIKAIAEAAEKADIAPPEEPIVASVLLKETPKAGMILSDTVDKETGAVELKLGNGLNVILKETKNKNNEISFYGLSRGGTMNVPDEMDISASLAVEMANASGLGDYKLPELIKILADKQASFGFWSSNFIRGFSGWAATKDAATLFELIYLGFTSPRLDDDTAQTVLDQYRTSLAQRDDNPEAYFSKELTKALFGNPRFAPLELADLDKFNIEDARDYIRTCSNPSDYTMVFTGNMDMDEMRKLCATYLASLPSPGFHFNKWKDTDFGFPGQTDKAVYKGQDEKSIVFLGWMAKADYSEEANAEVSALTEYLDIVLNDEIREKMGGVYSIGASVSLSTLPHGYMMTQASFGCDPARAEELTSAVMTALEAIAKGEIDADVLAKSKEALVKDHEKLVQDNAHIAQSYANSAVIYNSPLSRMDKKPALYQAVTADGLKATAAEFLGDGKTTGPVKVVLYPEGYTP
jgi:zinc protease